MRRQFLNLLVLGGMGSTDIISRHLGRVLGGHRWVNEIVTETPQREGQNRVGLLRFMVRLSRFLLAVRRQYKPGLLYLPSYELARYIWLLPGKKIVHVYDVRPLFETALMNPYSSFISKLMARLDLLGLRRAHLLCAPSQGIRSDLAAVGINPVKVRIVPMGLDRSVFGAQGNPMGELPPEIGPFASEEFVLYVGSAAPKKNLEVLIRGFGLLVRRSSYPRLKLAIIGPKSDTEADRLRKVARESGVEQRLLLFGSLSQTSLARLYSLAAAYVQPSTYEGFCITVLEAAACGTPVVATRIRGNVDALGDCALYFDPSSPEELSKQLDSVLKDPTVRAGLVQGGLERTACLSWEATGQRLLETCTGVTDHATL